MARLTNLIPHEDGKIEDVYLYLLNNLKDYLVSAQISQKKMEIIDN